MRLWTAIGSWAGLVAVSIALYALGVSLESKPGAASSALVPIAIGFGSLATLIFVGDLVYLARREGRRRRALRAPRKAFGSLDYQPEYTRATERYIEAQQQIADTMTSAAVVFTKNPSLASQDQANAVGKATHGVCEAYEQYLPVMKESGEIARQCLAGFLKTSRVEIEADRQALRDLRGHAKAARMSTTGYLRSTRDGKRSTATLRKKNISQSLNEPAIRLERHQGDATRTVRSVIRGMRSAERQMSRRLFWYSVRSRLTR